jgi:WD40 repeat protein
MKNLFDVFISYGRADSKNFATRLYDQLNSQGLEVWFDQQDIEDTVKWQKAIDQGIERSHNFIFIVAPHAVKSIYCLKEIELALQYNKRLIPLLHVYPADDWDKVHPAIAEIQFLPFQEGIDNFDQSFERLLNSIDKYFDYVKLHTELLIKALKWVRNQKQTSYLLTGRERMEAENWLKQKFEEQPPCLPTEIQCEFICESIKNANNLMTQVFLSHSDQDKIITEKIFTTLIRSCITIWSYRTDLRTGVPFQKEINYGIVAADNLIYIMSCNALQSQFCEDEINLALTYNKRIIPILIEEEAIKLIPPRLKALQFIDFTQYNDQTAYSASVDKLLNILSQDTSYYEQHKILLVKALKWKEQNRNHSILLRDYNLEYYQSWLKTATQRTEHLPIPLQEEFIAASLRQPPSLTLDVFISYSRADSDFARKLNEALQIQGKTTWFDQEVMAVEADFEQEIKEDIENSDNFLLIITPNSINCSYCFEQTEYAKKLNKKIVIIFYENIDPQLLPLGLTTLQWIDFNKNNQDFYGNFSELIRILDTDRDHVHSHTKWSQRAREWKENKYSSDLLLRGSEFTLAENWLQEAEEHHKQPFPTERLKAFITASKKAIEEANKAEEERRQQLLNLQAEKRREAEARLLEERKSARRIKYFLGAVIIGFVVSIVLGRQARLSEIQALSKYSEVLFISHKRLEALKEAIKAKQKLQYFLGADSFTQKMVEQVLQQAVYGVKEYNSFSGHRDRIYGIDWSPDGKFIASASADKTVRIWQNDGQFLYVLGCNQRIPLDCKNPNQHQERIWNVVFSSDGQMIATSSVDRTVKLWKWDKLNSYYKYYDTLKGHRGQVWKAVFSPDKQLIASGSDDETVKLWKLNQSDGSYQEYKTLKGHTSQIYAVAFSPDGKLIASASGDKTIKIWDTNGNLVDTLKGHQRGVRGVDFSPDGKLIASASDDKTVKLWKKDKLNGFYKEDKTLEGHTARVWSVSFSPNGKEIASGGFDQTVKLWTIDGVLLTTLQGHGGEVAGVTFSRDGHKIASGSWDKTVKLWKLNNQLFYPLEGHNSGVKSVAFRPDGKLLASASGDTIKLWKWDEVGNSYKYYDTLKGHQAVLYSVTFSPDGQLIASGADDNTARLWKWDKKKNSYQQYKILEDPNIELQGQNCQQKVNQTKQSSANCTPQTHQAQVRGIEFSPNGQLIVTGSNDHSIKLWNKNGTLIKTLRGHNDEINKVVFSNDGKLIASASDDHTVKLWDIKGNLVETLRGHNAGILGLDFSPDGKLMASAGGDNKVKLWKWDDQKGSYQNYKTLEGHTAGVEDINFSRDGQLIASASSDKTVKIWNTEGILLYTLTGHDDGVLGVNFSPDSKFIASASNDNTVILWDLDNFLSSSELLKRGCAWVKDYLDHNSELDNSDRNLCYSNLALKTIKYPRRLPLKTDKEK